MIKLEPVVIEFPIPQHKRPKAYTEFLELFEKQIRSATANDLKSAGEKLVDLFIDGKISLNDTNELIDKFLSFISPTPIYHQYYVTEKTNRLSRLHKILLKHDRNKLAEIMFYFIELELRTKVAYNRYPAFTNEHRYIKVINNPKSYDYYIINGKNVQHRRRDKRTKILVI